MRILFFLGIVCVVTHTTRAQPPAGSLDTEAATYARNVQLKTKITIEVKDMPLIDFMKELAAETEKQLVKTPKWTYAAEVSKTDKVNYRGKDKPLETILAEVFKAPGLGYVVIAKEDDKFDGFIRITKGTERGFATGAEPTAADRVALAKLESAKELIQAGKKLNAKAVLTLLAKDPNPAVAKEAARLLESLDK